MKRNLIVGAALAAGALPQAFAHAGHGAPLLHAHAAEWLGLVALAAAAVGAAAWLWQRGRR